MKKTESFEVASHLTRDRAELIVSKLEEYVESNSRTYLDLHFGIGTWPGPSYSVHATFDVGQNENGGPETQEAIGLVFEIFCQII